VRIEFTLSGRGHRLWTADFALKPVDALPIVLWRSRNPQTFMAVSRRRECRWPPARPRWPGAGSWPAARLFRDLIAHYVRVLGDDDPVTLQARYSLAINVGEAGDRTQAASLLRELVADEARVLGADHPDTLSSQQWLGYYEGR
jgi:hypothetical protein